MTSSSAYLTVTASQKWGCFLGRVRISCFFIMQDLYLERDFGTILIQVAKYEKRILYFPEYSIKDDLKGKDKI